MGRVIGSLALLWRSPGWRCRAKPAKSPSRHLCEASQIRMRSTIAIIIPPSPTLALPEFLFLNIVTAAVPACIQYHCRRLASRASVRPEAQISLMIKILEAASTGGILRGKAIVPSEQTMTSVRINNAAPDTCYDCFTSQQLSDLRRHFCPQAHSDQVALPLSEAPHRLLLLARKWLGLRSTGSPRARTVIASVPSPPHQSEEK